MPQIITCVPVDRADPRIAELPRAVRTIINRVTISAGYTETSCTVCQCDVYIGPVQRRKALDTGAAIVCYICIDPAELLQFVSQPAPAR